MPVLDQCLIDGVCYQTGDVNGTNNCSVCTPTKASTMWTTSSGKTKLNKACIKPLSKYP